MLQNFTLPIIRQQKGTKRFSNEKTHKVGKKMSNFDHFLMIARPN
jgi:hypothetical protein